MTDQLDLLSWGAENPQAATSELPQAIIKPAAPQHDYQIGEIVLISPLNADSDRPLMATGLIVELHGADMVAVNIGAGEPYRCGHQRLTRYTGVVRLWRPGSATCCERSDCRPHQSARPFSCSICHKRSTPNWWYVGHMADGDRVPRWPDAVWFPAKYDPNAQRFD